MTPAEVGSLSFICTRQPCKVDTKGESVLLYEPVRFVCLVPTASPCPSFPKETKRERERESERERLREKREKERKRMNKVQV